MDKETRARLSKELFWLKASPILMILVIVLILLYSILTGDHIEPLLTVVILGWVVDLSRRTGKMFNIILTEIEKKQPVETARE